MAGKGVQKGLEGAGQDVILKKEYTVTKFMTKRSHGMKPYEVDSVIKLTDEEAAPLVKHGYVKLKQGRSKLKE